jgi:hypothetical protein
MTVLGATPTKPPIILQDQQRRTEMAVPAIGRRAQAGFGIGGARACHLGLTAPDGGEVVELQRGER